MFVIVVEDITSHQSANSSHPNVRIAKKWENVQVQAWFKVNTLESTTLPKAEKNADSYSWLFTMTRGNVITESQKTSLSMHILLK